MKKDSKNYDLTSILKDEHAGKWVALSTDRKKVVGYSDTFKELEKKIGTKEVIYMKALKKEVTYAF